MAEYVPYIKEVIPEPFLYKPDFGFINQAMQRKQAQFEQGLGQLKSGYNSIRNAPLSNVNLIPIRDEYIRQADEQLKKLSSADLSLPQNVQAAEAVFSPFWQDPFILKDYNTTQKYQNQMQKLASWRDSKDSKVREMYSPVVMQYLSNGLRKLQTAELTPEAFNQIETREAVPFTNIENYLQEQAKANADGEGGLKIVWDQTSPDGAYLVKTTNGQKSQKRFANWAEGMLGNNFKQQFDITGIVQAENLEANLRQNPMYANMSAAEMKTVIADYVVTNLSKGYETRIGNINQAITETDSLLKSYPDNITDPAQIAAARKLIQERDDLIKLKGSVEAEYTGFTATDSKERLGLIDRVKTSPSSYFATLAKQTLINNWSSARADISSEEFRPNTAFFDAQRIQQDKDELAFQRQQQADLNAWRQAVLNKKGGTGTGKGASVTLDENGNPVIGFTGMEGEDKATGARYMGLGTTDITQTASAADVFNARQAKLVENANNALYGDNGTVNVLRNAGLTADEVMQISSGIKRQLEQGDRFSWTEDESKALYKLSTAPEFQKYYKDATVVNLKEGILNYAKDFYAQKRDNKIAFTNEDLQVMSNYRLANNLSQEYLANHRNRQDLVKEHILSNPKKYEQGATKIIVTKENGEKDIVSAEDIEKLLPKDYNWGITYNDKPLDNKTIARLILAGRLDLPRDGGGGFKSDRGDIIIDGKSYIQPKDVIATGAFSSLRSGYRNKLNEVLHQSVEKVFGKLPAMAKLYAEANSAVVPNLQYFQNKIAQVGTVWNLDLDDVKGDPQAFTVFQESLQPGNQLNWYTVDVAGNRKELDKETRDSFRQLLNNRDNLKELVGAFEYHTQRVNGNPTISFNLKQLPSNSKLEINGTPLTDLTGRFDIELSPAAKGPNINNLPRNNGNYVYEQLLQGKSIKSDDFLNSFGISYQVVPNDNRNPDGGRVIINYDLGINSKDPQTGQIVHKMEPKTYEQIFSFAGDNRMTPDEVMAMIENKITELMLINQQTKKQYDTFMQSSNAPSYDLGSELRQLGIK